MGRPPKFGTHRISCLIFIASLFSAGIMPGCLHVPELPKVPDDLRTAKIDRGKADFAKVIFDRYPELGQITDLRYGRFGNDMESELAVVGTAGAAFVGRDRRIKKTVRFAPRMFNPVVLIQPKDGVAPVFLGRGGSWGEKVRVFDANGALLWEYGSFWGINGSAGGDIKADGKLEFAVALNGWGGVRLLSAQGDELWSMSAANVWHVEMANPEQGAPGNIINSDAGGALTIRNDLGQIVRTCRPTEYVGDFGLVCWASEPEPRHLVVPGKDVIEVLDLNGQQTAQLQAPGCVANSTNAVTGTPVCFSSGRCYQATLVFYRLWDRSVLYLNGQTGKIAYREVFEHRCATVGTMPAAPGARDESLLVGCSNEIWKYVSLH